MNASWTACAAAAALVVAGCGAGESSGEAAARFCRRGLESLARQSARCEAWAPAYLESWLADVPANCDIFRPSVDAGRESFDPVRAATCLEAMEEAASSCPFTMPAACLHVLTSQVPMGGACRYSSDCTAGVCELPPACQVTALGRCVASNGSGDTCDAMVPAFSPTPCGADQECEWDGDRYACMVPPTPVGEGDPCGVGAPCGAELYCRPPPAGTVTESGTCAPRAGLGDPCRLTFECSRDLTCGPQRVCARFVGQGASCADPTTACGEGLFCDEGTCAPVPGLGASCVRAGRCLEGWCSTTDDLCHPLKAEGEPCGSWTECDSYDCEDGTCAAYCRD